MDDDDDDEPVNSNDSSSFVFESVFKGIRSTIHETLSLSFSIYIYIDSVLSRIGETHFAQPFKYLPRIRVALEEGSSDWQSIIEIFSHRVSFDRRWRSFDHCYPLPAYIYTYIYIFIASFFDSKISDCYFEIKYSNIWFEGKIKREKRM